MINVITLDREYGSGGAEIARRLAEKLDWKLHDQSLTDGIARLMKCERCDVEGLEEKRDPLYYRLLRSFMRGSFEGNMNAPAFRVVDADRIFSATKRLVGDAAKAGRGVIVGRGGAHFLQQRADAYHVFIYAPLEDRIRRLCRSGISEKEAASQAASVDEERAEFVRNYFKMEWPMARSSFHLMVNSHAGEELAVETILRAVDVFDRAGV